MVNGIQMERMGPTMKLNKLLLTLSLSAAFLVSPAQSQETDPSELLKVVSYDLVSKKRVGRSTFEYEYALKVENNTSTGYSGVFVTLSASSDKVQLTDASAEIGTVNAFSAKDADDTIKVRIDRRTRFNPINLNATFDDETLAGIDANSDGLRDSVEQVLSSFFESDSKNLQIARTRSLAQQQSYFSESLSEEALRNLNQRTVLSSFCLEKNGVSISSLNAKTLLAAVDNGTRKAAYSAYQQELLAISPIDFPLDGEINLYCQSFD